MVPLWAGSVDGDVATGYGGGSLGGGSLGGDFIGVSVCVGIGVGEVLMEDSVWFAIEASYFGGFFVAVGTHVDVVVVAVSAGYFALFAVGLDASFETLFRIAGTVGDDAAASQPRGLCGPR